MSKTHIATLTTLRQSNMLTGQEKKALGAAILALVGTPAPTQAPEQASPEVAESAPPAALSNWVWQHVKSGGEHLLLGDARLQSDAPLTDMAEVYVYQGKDGRMWVRPAAEFDVRFKRLHPAPASAQAVCKCGGPVLDACNKYACRFLE